MAYLPLANILHHKLRSLLSALGVGMGICMLVTLSGLSRGSLNEIADRWEAVRADFIVFPRGLDTGAVTASGAMLHDRWAERILEKHGDRVRRVVPVFAYPIRLAGQDQMSIGVEPGDLPLVTGGRQPRGRVFDPDGAFSEWIVSRVRDAPTDGPLVTVDKAELSRPGRNGLEIVIDERLARAGGYELGQTVRTADHTWTVVGIVPAGGLGRVYLPRRTAQFLFDDGSLAKSTFFFVQLAAGARADAARRALAASIRPEVVPLKRYRGMLRAKFGIMYTYVDAVNAFALVIAFLFIMTMLYMTVLQQTREIAVLKSCGASNAFIVRQVLGEAALVTAAGVALGVGLSVLARWLIETLRPLLTVTITWQWITIAAAAAAGGAVLSALLPAWRATRVDMARALTAE